MSDQRPFDGPAPDHDATAARDIIADQDITADHAALAGLLREATPGFDTGFADRVMARLDVRRREEADLEQVMRRQFKRWAPIGFAAGLVLAAFNFAQAAGDASQSPLEAMLGLEPVAVGYAYSIEIPGMDVTGDEP